MAENTNKPTPNAPSKKEPPAKPAVAAKAAPVEIKPVNVPKPAPIEAKPAPVEPKPVTAIKPTPVDVKPVTAAKPVVTSKEPSAVAAPKAAPVAAKPAPEAPKTKSAPPAPAPAPKPAEVVASKRDEPTVGVTTTPPIASPVPSVASVAKHEAPPITAAAITEGSRIMNETMTKAQETAKKFTADAGERVQALFGEVSERAKGAYEKSVKLTEELTEFQKGNVEAFVESSKLAAKAAESLGQEAADYARKSFENSTAAMKTFASAKSPSELFKLQSDYMKSSFDAAVAESSKVTEAWLKLAGDVAQPLSNRLAVAVEKVKTTTTM
ncbi:MAG TPA: TIGR01841 family phasin [Acetobacteraceae bacterium]|nr:TIGR01841 family phasin [Acetobacteraceae bacterium]